MPAEITKVDHNSSTYNSEFSLVQDPEKGQVLQVDVKGDWAGATFALNDKITLPGTYIFEYDIKSTGNTKGLLTTEHDSGKLVEGTSAVECPVADSFTTVQFNKGNPVTITGDDAYFTIQDNRGGGSDRKFWISSLRIYKTAPDYGNSKEIDSGSGLKLTFGQNSITKGNISKGGKITEDGRSDSIMSTDDNTAVLTLPSVNLNSQYNSVVVNLEKIVSNNNPNPVSFDVYVGETKAAEFKNVSTYKSINGSDEKWDDQHYFDFTSPIAGDAKNASGNVVLKISIPGGSFIGNFASVTFKTDSASAAPVLKDGEAVGGYYTEGDTAESDKIGIIRFFQQYKGNNNISQYGFYFVDSDGKILDYEKYINQNGSFDEQGFYGDLINAQFNTAYHAKAFVVTTGGQIYFSDTISGKANEENWFKNPNYNN